MVMRHVRLSGFISIIITSVEIQTRFFFCFVHGLDSDMMSFVVSDSEILMIYLGVNDV